MEVLHKKMRTTEGSEGDGGVGDVAVEEEVAAETNMSTASEELESCIQAILEKIERFTQQVSDLLDSGKEMFSNLTSQFEERMISIHREQVEKWQEEIKELRSLDSSNEAGRDLLQNAQLHLYHSVTRLE